MDKIVFLDRDGTINEEVHYLYQPEDLQILPGVPRAMKAFRDAGYKVVVVTNQAGVARGYYSCADVERLHAYLNEQLQKEGAWIDHFFYCPHHPEHGIGEYKTECTCRKPGIGMFQMAEEFYEVDKARSYMIGDKLLDIEAGNRYGVTGILVGTGYGASIHRQQADNKEEWIYEFYAEDLMGAARIIMQREGREKSDGLSR
ncbi:MAG: HAD family hydrolase [Hungatella sp.]